jgi:hypothetical protein
MGVNNGQKISAKDKDVDTWSFNKHHNPNPYIYFVLIYFFITDYYMCRPYVDTNVFYIGSTHAI